MPYIIIVLAKIMADDCEHSSVSFDGIYMGFSVTDSVDSEALHLAIDTVF